MNYNLQIKVTLKFLIFSILIYLISVVVTPSTSPDAAETLPPTLSIESIEFEETLDAGETAKLLIVIKNTGDGDAIGMTVQLRSKDLQGLSFPPFTNVPDIPKRGGTKTVEIDIIGSFHLPDAKATIEIHLDEPAFGQQIPGRSITFKTRKMPIPKLILADYGVKEKQSASPNNRIDLNEVIELTFYIQNVGKSAAEDVTVRWKMIRLG